MFVEELLILDKAFIRMLKVHPRSFTAAVQRIDLTNECLSGRLALL